MKGLVCLLLASLALPSMLCSAPDDRDGKRVHVQDGPLTVELEDVPEPAPNERLVLHLDDVRPLAGRSAVFRVFVNNPGATAATPTTDPTFVDEVVLVPSRSEETGGRAPGQNLTLPLGHAARNERRGLTVTLVPVQADTQGRLRLPGSADLTLRRPRVSAERQGSPPPR